MTTKDPQRIDWDWKNWAVTLWTGTGFYHLKVCRCWDGQFIVDGKTLPLWGRRPESRISGYDKAPGHHCTRYSRGWRAWMPYFMVWHLTNYQDHDVVQVPDGDPRIGTTERIR